MEVGSSLVLMMPTLQSVSYACRLMAISGRLLPESMIAWRFLTTFVLLALMLILIQLVPWALSGETLLIEYMGPDCRGLCDVSEVGGGGGGVVECGERGLFDDLKVFGEEGSEGLIGGAVSYVAAPPLTLKNGLGGHILGDALHHHPAKGMILGGQNMGHNNHYVRGSRCHFPLVRCGDL